jgi:glycosyltransferase involved in cell wall biosynthesis
LKRQAGPHQVHALELASQSSDYAWNRSEAADLITLCPDAVTESLSFREVFQCARRAFSELKLEACLLPSYSPKPSLAALLAAKSLGIRTVMMNETHAGTARARGIGACVKRRLVGLFDAALVGGAPQKRYFASLGIPEERIFTGYDAVDNDHFAQRADEVRDHWSEFRDQYELPEHYFLSLGRFVAKKNLTTLIRAYRNVLEASPGCQTQLVMVGSGEQEPALHTLCHELHLPIYSKMSAGKGTRKMALEWNPPGVHFYGFRQIDENPVFYALADAFILPSLWEEWGLVVNEAMASGLPVVVSEAAGCAEDLLRSGRPPLANGRTAGLGLQSGDLAGRIRQNGVVFDPNSPESLAAALLVLVSDPELGRAMGRASREIIRDFSCEVFARNALLAARAATGESLPVPAQSARPRHSAK